MRVRILKTVSYVNKVLDLRIYRLTRTDRIITLSSISSQRVYIVPINRALNETLHSHSVLTDDFRATEESLMNLLHCT